jgi:hypothetical protein
VIRSY